MNIHTTPAFYGGATVTILRQFDPGRALHEIEHRRITLLLTVPPVARALIAHPAWDTTDLSSLRCLAIGSSIVPIDVMRPWLDRGVPVTQVYGLTETCPIAIVLPLQDSERKLASVGKPVLYCQARVVDVNGHDVEPGERGEIVLRGPNVLTQYWMNPQATRAAFVDGWFRTGDVGHVDPERYFYIDDRIKDIIIVGPSNVYPTDLERILVECDAIAEAVMVGRPDPDLGEVPVACGVLRPDHAMSADQVKALFKGRLADYQHPRDVMFMDSLPHTALGKVQKPLVREQVKALMGA
jgi:fatty-acyl-CoA synthase